MGRTVMLNLFQHPGPSRLAGENRTLKQVQGDEYEVKLRASSALQRLYPILLYIRNGPIVHCGSSLSVFNSPAARGAFAMQGLRLIAAASMAGATCFGSGTASARFLQVDPVGYQDQVNLYAYVNNDPINASDPTGTTCTSSQQGEKTTYSCRIDGVAVVKDGKFAGSIPATPAQEKKFAAFNARYTATVNKLMSNPNKAVTVAPIKGKEGSFQTTAGQAGQALISRQFLYVGKDGANQAMMTLGGPGIGKDAITLVRPIGLSDSGIGIVHDGGLHGTPEEAKGKLQTPEYPLGKLEHQKQYNDAACALLGGNC